MRAALRLWWAVAVLGPLVLCVPRLRHALPGCAARVESQPELRARLERLARRQPTALNCFVLAELETAGTERQWQAYGRALAADPRDETALLRRAAYFTALATAAPGHADEALRSLQTAFPDNARGYYLEALRLARLGDRQAMVAALRRGSDAKRYETGHRVAAERCQAVAGPLGNALGESVLLTAESPAWRQFVREARFDLSTRAGLATAFEVARMGARLREESDEIVPALTGDVLLTLALSASQAPEKVKLTERQRQERRLAQAREFDRRLAAAGHLAPAGWAEQQVQRSLRFHTRLRAAVGDCSAHLGRSGHAVAWSVWLHMLRAATILVLLLHWPLCRDPRPPLEWGWADLGRLALVGLAPALVLMALLAPLAASVADESAWPPWRDWAPLVTPLLPLVLVRLALVARGSQFRCAQAGEPLSRRDVVRRSWPAVSLALSATLLLVMLASSAPAARQLERFTRESRTALDVAVLAEARR